MVSTETLLLLVPTIGYACMIGNFISSTYLTGNADNCLAPYCAVCEYSRQYPENVFFNASAWSCCFLSSIIYFRRYQYVKDCLKEHKLSVTIFLLSCISNVFSEGTMVLFRRSLMHDLLGLVFMISYLVLIPIWMYHNDLLGIKDLMRERRILLKIIYLLGFQAFVLVVALDVLEDKPQKSEDVKWKKLWLYWVFAEYVTCAVGGAMLYLFCLDGRHEKKWRERKSR